MAYCIDFLEVGDDANLAVGESIEKEFHSHRMVGDFFLDYGRGFTCGFVYKLAAFEVDFLNHALGEQRVLLVLLHVQQLVLDGGTSAIDDKYLHNGRKVSKIQSISEFGLCACPLLLFLLDIALVAESVVAADFRFFDNVPDALYDIDRLTFCETGFGTDGNEILYAGAICEREVPYFLNILSRR